MSERLARRHCGVLLHLTSLPSPTLAAGLRFVDWLAASGCSVWQILPFGPVAADGSPYSALSAFAGDERLFGDRVGSHVQPVDDVEDDDLAAFRAESVDWLPDYALFRALRAHHEDLPWTQWPTPLRDREPRAMAAAQRQHTQAIAAVERAQCGFFRAWRQLRAHANARGIELIGDLPFFVAHDSADVWANRTAFQLDADGMPLVVAGVPPDYFSATGQRWGNPLYNWPHMQADGFRWWRRRVGCLLRDFDRVRIDHFRAFSACWEIPASEPTAMQGRWAPVPGGELLASLAADNGDGRLIAEDLGVLTDDVHSLRQRFRLPGMRVLQFAFGDGADNPHVPHRHSADSVVYTGTHDNDTSLGWYQSLIATERARVDAYLGYPGEPMPWPLLRAALASVAQTAILPMQDLLGLDGRHRMNVPGTTSGNWQWRFAWEDVPADLALRLRSLLALYERL